MTELPLFPLHTVLFPGGLLPLRIFEPRYLDMVGRCMKDGGDFGVLLLTAGGETGPVGGLRDIGCSARIVDFEQLPDRLLGVLCRGGRRFRLHSRHTQADGLHVGEIEWFPDTVPAPLVAEHQPLAEVLRKVVDSYGPMRRFLEPAWDDAHWISNRLAELLPLDREAQQQLLEMEDPQQRLRVLAPMIQPP